MANTTNELDLDSSPMTVISSDVTSGMMTDPPFPVESSLPEDPNAMVLNDNDDNNNDDEDDDTVRRGTMASARFNILSTMVGGGCLSLPMAFQKTGPALFAPLFLLLIATLTEFCFRTLVTSARRLSPPSSSGMTARGKESYESIAHAAFGKHAQTFSACLVTLMCFFGIVGYAVLLRDMLQPLADWHRPSSPSGPTWAHNAALWMVVVAVTPLCTWKTLTSLQHLGALSMCSILILGSCIVYRSAQCNWNYYYHHNHNHNQHQHTFHFHADESTQVAFRYFPASFQDWLDAFPLFISCYVCHYNIVTVHNELRQPTLLRVHTWLRTTTLAATTLYMILGVSGSAYAKCTPTGRVHGNVLLDFDEHDPLLLVGRLCLAVTLALAFPVLTLPARDIVLRSVASWSGGGWSRSQAAHMASALTNPLGSLSLDSPDAALQEALLNQLDDAEDLSSPLVDSHESKSSSRVERWIAAMGILWTATALASCVASIDIVWDLLGSSLSMILSYIIPCASYIVLMRAPRRLEDDVEEDEEEDAATAKRNHICAWILLVISFPLMIASSVNAIHNTFFAK
jgi:amino acid permease